MGTVSIEKELVKLESMVPALKNKENEMVGLFHNHWSYFLLEAI